MSSSDTCGVLMFSRKHSGRIFKKNIKQWAYRVTVQHSLNYFAFRNTVFTFTCLHSSMSVFFQFLNLTFKFKLKDKETSDHIIGLFWFKRVFKRVFGKLHFQ